MQAAYVKQAGVYETGTESVRSNAVLVRNILRILYTIVPIAAGLDKFLNLLTDWTHYLNPLVTRTTGFSAGLFMNIVGVIEIAAGILVLLYTKIGAYIVSAWLLAIALQLLAGGMYLDVAVRDIAMSVGAFCLARLYE